MLCERHCEKNKNTSQRLGKILAKHISNKVVVFKIFLKSLKLKKEKKQLHFKNEQKI